MERVALARLANPTRPDEVMRTKRFELGGGGDFCAPLMGAGNDGRQRSDQKGISGGRSGGPCDIASPITAAGCRCAMVYLWTETKDAASPHRERAASSTPALNTIATHSVVLELDRAVPCVSLKCRHFHGGRNEVLLDTPCLGNRNCVHKRSPSRYGGYHKSKLL